MKQMEPLEDWADALPEGISSYCVACSCQVERSNACAPFEGVRAYRVDRCWYLKHTDARAPFERMVADGVKCCGKDDLGNVLLVGVCAIRQFGGAGGDYQAA